jgi:hypothetical protein
LVIGITKRWRAARTGAADVVSPASSAATAASAMCQPWLVTNSHESCGAQTGTGSPPAETRGAPSARPKHSASVGSATATASQLCITWVPSGSTSGTSPPSADCMPPSDSGTWSAIPP